MSNEIMKWIYDSEDDHGEKSRNTFFIGTEKEFDEMRTNCENLWGMWFYNIRKEEPTKQEIREWYEDW